jgi:hypothetical protein
MIPAKPAATPVSGRLRLRAWHFVIGTLLVALLLGGFVVWRFFHLGSETETLRASLIQATHARCEKRIALHVGMFSTALVRAGSRFLTMPPEPRAALEAVRSVEFGVYQLQDELTQIKAGAVLASTDKAMATRGWERCVGVVHEHQIVAVYVPKHAIGSRDLKCCLLVLESRNLVVLSATGKLEPLITLAQSKLGPEWEKHSAERVSFNGNVASNRL